MKLIGHKTEHAYRQYEIVSEADLTEAVQKITGLGRDELQSHLDHTRPKKHRRKNSG